MHSHPKEHHEYDYPFAKIWGNSYTVTMRRIVIMFPLVFVLTGCSLTSTPKEERHKIEMSLHKVRTDIEEIKHDCNTAEIELHILEGKVIDQEAAISSVKDKVIESQKSKIDSLEEKIATLEKRLATSDKKNDELKQDMRKLAKHANETTSAFAQYKEKISELESEIHGQEKKFQEISQIKESIALLAKEIDQKKPTTKYVIVDGDSIEKIARKFGTSADTIRKMNRLESDLIRVGEEIVVPGK